MTDTAAHAGVVAPVESGCTCSVCRQDYPQIEEVGWFTSKWWIQIVLFTFRCELLGYITHALSQIFYIIIITILYLINEGLRQQWRISGIEYCGDLFWSKLWLWSWSHREVRGKGLLLQEAACKLSLPVPVILQITPFSHVHSQEIHTHTLGTISLYPVIGLCN